MKPLNLSEAWGLITQAFPEAIPLQAEGGITQEGLYLTFEGLTPHNATSDLARFSLLLAGHRLSDKGEGGILASLEAIRGRIWKLFLPFQERGFLGVRPLNLEAGTLFIYVMSLEVKVGVNTPYKEPLKTI